MKKLALCLLALSLAVFMAGSAFAVTADDITLAVISADAAFEVVSVDLVSDDDTIVAVSVDSLNTCLKDARAAKLSVDLEVYSNDVELFENILYVKKSADAFSTGMISVDSMVSIESNDIKISSSDAYFLFEGHTFKNMDKASSDDWKTYVESVDGYLYFRSNDISKDVTDFTIYGVSGDLSSDKLASTDIFKAYVRVCDKLPKEVAAANIVEALTAVDGLEFPSTTGLPMLSSADVSVYVNSSDVIMAHAKKGELEVAFGASMDKKSNDFSVAEKASSSKATETKDFTALTVKLTVSDDKTVALIVTAYTDTTSADFNLMLTSEDAANLTADDNFKFSFKMPVDTEIYLNADLSTDKVSTDYAEGMRTFYATKTNSPDMGVTFDQLRDGRDFYIKDTSTTPGSSSSSGCNAVGFVPAALLLVAPLFFLKK